MRVDAPKAVIETLNNIPQRQRNAADLAAQLVAGLGLNVVSPSSSASSVGEPGTEETAAEASWAVGGDEEEEEGGGENAATRLGGWFDDGQNASRRERTRAIRREEKEGKSAEKVGGGGPGRAISIM